VLGKGADIEGNERETTPQGELRRGAARMLCASASMRENRNPTFVAFLILILTQGNAQILLGQNLHLTLGFLRAALFGATLNGLL